MALANFIWPLGYNMYINFFPIHIRQSGGDDFIVSLIISIPLFAGVLCIVGGILADYVDRKKTMLFGWAVTIPAPLIWAFADGWEWLLIGTIIFSLTQISMPAFTIYIFDHQSPGNKMLAFSIIAIGNASGSILGPFVGGTILDGYGTKPLYLLIFLLYTVSTFCFIPVARQAQKSRRPIVQYLKWNSIFGAYSIRKLTLVFLFLAALSFVQNISGPYLPLFLNEFKLISVDRIGFAFTVLAAGSLLFTWIYGKTAGKVPIHAGILTGLLLFLLGLAITIYANDPFWLTCAFFLRGITLALATYVLGSVAFHLAGENKGLILSLFIAVRGIFIGAAAFPGAFLYRIDPHLLFYAEAILIVIWVLLSFHYFFRNYWLKPDLQK